MAALLGMAAYSRGAGLDGLARFFEGAQGAAVLVDVQSRRVIASHGQATAQLIPPGSALKPFVMEALLRAGKLRAEEAFPCPIRLAIAGRSFNCSHPQIAAPMRIATALAYSCNCFVAHFAERFAPGELALALERAGFGVPCIVSPAGGDANRLQALGEDRVLVTPAAMAMAWRRLALASMRPELHPILEGLEGAVEFGTAQLARLPDVRVAGKTGSALDSTGAHFAWFTGFAPSRAPRVAVTVVLQGRSGGADAAPIAGRILVAYEARKL